MVGVSIWCRITVGRRRVERCADAAALQRAAEPRARRRASFRSRPLQNPRPAPVSTMHAHLVVARRRLEGFGEALEHGDGAGLIA